MHNYTFIILLLLKAALVNPFYLPGLTPVNFCPKEMEKPNCKSDIKVYVNRLNSKNTILDYEYHDFDFCLGNEHDDTPVENLGQVLFGERIRPSPYKVIYVDVYRSSRKNGYGEVYLFNHVDFIIEYRDLSHDPNYFDDPVGGRIISVKVVPSSLNHIKEDSLDCDNSEMLNLNDDFHDMKIIYTYSVKFLDDVQEEFGWKLVHGDVFRPPACRLLLSVFLGSGAQILCMVFVTLVLACLGFLSPARRGALMTCGVALYRWSYPVRTNQIPRQIPPQPFFSKPLPATVMAGILPFGSIYVQMFFMFNSLWAHLTYYMFGFLFVVYLILLVTISETSIILCYFQLCGEDYRWWWRAFFSSAFTAFYLLAYSVYFYLYKLTIVGVVSTVLYFSYCLIFVFIFFIMCGKYCCC
ncbi:endomembrane protein 70 [Trichinella nativa]|uniref:Transmembrane 9 superfamily member n=1 Tax=Trichinella nativa TaxID=6335 RepID=A0A1Y3EYI3_9BILA|nr:endomembrane protein 70 [Trichinella nativa]